MCVLFILYVFLTFKIHSNHHSFIHSFVQSFMLFTFIYSIWNTVCSLVMPSFRKFYLTCPLTSVSRVTLWFTPSHSRTHSHTFSHFQLDTSAKDQKVLKNGYKSLKIRQKLPNKRSSWERTKKKKKTTARRESKRPKATPTTALTVVIIKCSFTSFFFRILS